MTVMEALQEEMEIGINVQEFELLLYSWCYPCQRPMGGACTSIGLGFYLQDDHFREPQQARTSSLC